MKKANAKKIAEKIETYLEALGIAFSFITTSHPLYSRHIDGFFDHNTWTIYVRRNADINTYAHEIAHAEQYDKLGDTRCAGMGGDSEIVLDHTNRTQKWENILRSTGFLEVWKTAHN